MSRSNGDNQWMMDYSRLRAERFIHHMFLQGQCAAVVIASNAILLAALLREGNNLQHWTDPWILIAVVQSGCSVILSILTILSRTDKRLLPPLSAYDGSATALIDVNLYAEGAGSRVARRWQLLVAAFLALLLAGIAILLSLWECPPRFTSDSDTPTLNHIVISIQLAVASLAVLLLLDIIVVAGFFREPSLPLMLWRWMLNRRRVRKLRTWILVKCSLPAWLRHTVQRIYNGCRNGIAWVRRRIRNLLASVASIARSVFDRFDESRYWSNVEAKRAEFTNDRLRRGQFVWGHAPASSAEIVAERFAYLASENRSPLILVAGCGYGRNAMYFAKRGWSVIGVDSSDEAIRMAQVWASRLGSAVSKRTLFIEEDIRALPKEMTQYDVVYCGKTLHQFRNNDRTEILKDLFDRLKPDGILGLSTYACHGRDFRTAKREGVWIEMRTYDYRKLQPTHFFGKIELERQLRRAGFNHLDIIPIKEVEYHSRKEDDAWPKHTHDMLLAIARKS